jgi:hypothetical protein
VECSDSSSRSPCLDAGSLHEECYWVETAGTSSVVVQPVVCSAAWSVASAGTYFLQEGLQGEDDIGDLVLKLQVTGDWSQKGSQPAEPVSWNTAFYMTSTVELLLFQDLEGCSDVSVLYLGGVRFEYFTGCQLPWLRSLRWIPGYYLDIGCDYFLPQGL